MAPPRNAAGSAARILEAFCCDARKYSTQRRYDYDTYQEKSIQDASVGIGVHRMLCVYARLRFLSSANSTRRSDGLSGGAIAGIVIGSVLVAGLGGFAVFWFAIRKKTFADLIAVVKGRFKKQQ